MTTKRSSKPTTPKKPALTKTGTLSPFVADDILNPLDSAIENLLHAAESLCEGQANDAPLEVLQALGHLVTVRRNVHALVSPEVSS